MKKNNKYIILIIIIFLCLFNCVLFKNNDNIETNYYDNLFENIGNVNIDTLLIKSNKTKKPLILYFTGHSNLNSKKLEQYILTTEIKKRLANDFLFIPLHVDDHQALPEREWVTKKENNQTIKTVGQKNSYLQLKKFNNNRQPHIILIDKEGKEINSINYTNKSKEITEFLNGKIREQKKIHNLFEKVNKYESSEEYEKLFSLSNKKTVNYFTNLKKITISGDSCSIRKLNLFDKLLVLQFRGTYNKSELDTISGKRLFLHYFKSTETIKEMITDRVIKNININYSSEANAEINSKTIPNDFNIIIKFTKENNKWKLDFKSYFESRNKGIEMIRELNPEQSEDDYLKNCLEWKGINKQYTNLWKDLKNN